jgi:hypothetical protein
MTELDANRALAGDQQHPADPFGDAIIGNTFTAPGRDWQAYLAAQRSAAEWMAHMRHIGELLGTVAFTSGAFAISAALVALGAV